jgi:hypothetical protein
VHTSFTNSSHTVPPPKIFIRRSSSYYTHYAAWVSSRSWWLSGSKQEQEHVLMCHAMLRGCGFKPCNPPCEFSASPVPDVKQAHFTGMAQRQRAWLITTRSLDRNGLSVSFTHRIGASRHWSTLSHRCIKALEHLIASVHQGTGAPYHRLSLTEERRAHNPEVTGSTPVGGILRIHVLYRSAQPPHEEGRQAGRKTEHS